MPLSAPALRKIPDALFFRPREQLVLRLKRPAAVRPVAVEGQVDFQAVWQQLHGTCELLGGLAEGPEHGGGVRAPGHGVSWWGRGAGAPRTRAPSLVAVRGEGASFTVGDPYTRDLPDPRAGQSRDGADCDRSRSAGVVQRDTVTKWRNDATG